MASRLPQTSDRSRSTPDRLAARLDGAGQKLLLGALWIIALLAGLGSQYLPIAMAPDDSRRILLCALLLNIALSLIGAVRHRRLAVDGRNSRIAAARFQNLALHDPLTGLANRRALLELAIARVTAATRRWLCVAVLIIDIDNFGSVNEGRGHDAGDAILVDIAAALTAIVPPSATLARLSGDQFACLMTFNPGHPEPVTAVADAIVARLARPFASGRGSVRMTGSVGIGRTEARDLTIDPAMRRADIALSTIKKSGGARACWFDARMGRELATRTAIEAGLRVAIPTGRIIPHYEQQIDLASGRLVGFEVQARWDHPTDGILLPDLFGPVAEEVGLMSGLSMTVMRQAFEHAAGWAPSLTLSVNISPSQLRDPWLAEKILKLLIETNFPPQRLEIEITEIALFDNLALAQSIVTSLKNQGVRLALDDFGTGYSSLAHLRALPFDRMKIARSFVLAMDDPAGVATVEAITRLGHSLSVPVTVEGVESAVAAERLRALGCHRAQGGLYGRPLNVQQVRHLLADRALLGTARVA